MLCLATPPTKSPRQQNQRLIEPNSKRIPSNIEIIDSNAVPMPQNESNTVPGHQNESNTVPMPQNESNMVPGHQDTVPVPQNKIQKEPEPVPMSENESHEGGDDDMWLSPPCDDILLLSNEQTYFDDDVDDTEGGGDSPPSVTATDGNLSKVLPDGPVPAVRHEGGQHGEGVGGMTHGPTTGGTAPNGPVPVMISYSQPPSSIPSSIHPPLPYNPMHSPVPPMNPPPSYAPPQQYTPTQSTYLPHPPNYSPYQQQSHPLPGSISPVVPHYDQYNRSSSFPVMQPPQVPIDPPATPPAYPSVDRSTKPSSQDLNELKPHVLTSLG